MHKTVCLVLFYKEVVVYIYTTSGILRSLLSIAELHIKPLYHFHHVMFDDMIVYMLKRSIKFSIYVDMLVYVMPNDNNQCTGRHYL